MKTCTFEECTEPLHAKGLCRSHYVRNWKYGDPGIELRITGDDERRFWSYVLKGAPHDCWVWTGALKPNGYGFMRVRNPRRNVHVHRFAYELLVGPIPDGLTIDHLCRTRACVRPSHLEPVTRGENARRAVAARRSAA